MIAIVDYGAGNIFSVKNALDFLGLESQLTDDAAAIQAADAIILPGVGAFPSAMQMLKERHLVSVLQTESKKKPFLGICLGMQLIFEKGYEFEACDGLGLIPGTVEKIPANGLIIPHMGWNNIRITKDSKILKNIGNEPYVYFVHSYYLKAQEESIVKASTYYGNKIHASVEKGNVFACQFHPEKSGETGLRILKNFVQIGREEA